ncbi:MAG: hypothetical protein IKO41_00165 [Lachnospiraceae bacterium]|nr:hypothetical protein [Lachnospiraceae bacterium]
MVSVKTARRLTDAFLTEGLEESDTDRKLRFAILAILYKESGERRKMPGKLKAWKNGGWTSGELFGGRMCTYPGAASYMLTSPESIDMLNHCGMFLWEATEFVLAVWAMRLFLDLDGESVWHAYERMKAEGFQEIFNIVKRNPVSFYFEDPVIWDWFEENAVIDDAFYLYGVLSENPLPEDLRERVEKGADEKYLNSFLLRLLMDIGQDCEDGDGWIFISDPVIRQAVLHMAITVTEMDGLAALHYVSSKEMGWYLSGGAKMLSPKKRKVLDDLFGIMMEGRRDRGNGLDSAMSFEGMSASGEFVSCVMCEYGDFCENEWCDHASALFHLLVRQWKKDLT